MFSVPGFGKPRLETQNQFVQLLAVYPTLCRLCDLKGGAWILCPSLPICKEEVYNNICFVSVIQKFNEFLRGNT